MSHTTRRRALAAAATALLALAPSALAADRAPQPGPPNHPSAVTAQPGALTGTHAQTPSDIDRACDANVGAYTPGSIPAVSYPSGGAYTPGAIPAVSYPRPVAPARRRPSPRQQRRRRAERRSGSASPAACWRSAPSPA